MRNIAKLRHHTNVPLIASITDWSLLPKIFLLEKIKYVNDDDDGDDDDDDDDDDTNSHSQSFYKIASLKNFEDFTKTFAKLFQIVFFTERFPVTANLRKIGM